MFSRAVFALALAALAALSGYASAQRVRAPQRIVSLIPSLTEDLCSVGAARSLVGVDRFSRDLPCARSVPAIADFATLDLERIVALHPGVVVGLPSQRRLTEGLRRAGVATTFYRDDTYEDIFTNVRAMGALTGNARRANALIRILRRETARLRSGEHFRRTPRIFVALGTSPIYTIGPSSYLATLVRFAGAVNAANIREAFGTYSAEALVRAQPDIIVSDPAIHLQGSLRREPWRSLRAVRAGRVYEIAHPDTLMRPGPRYNEGLHWLIERLRPFAT
ncbi:MAG: helical backbone metal receptor [Candidatus Eremiobacteraeota bacterium]|nr:helical backbone metal receptor [Candidatus Eremiobacteraeota bacterium]